MAQQFDYWLQLCYPSDTESIAQVVDDGLWKVMERCVGQEVSRVGEDQWRGASFNDFVVRQPVKMGGMGLRRQVSLARPAFVGALDQVARLFVAADPGDSLVPSAR